MMKAEDIRDWDNTEIRARLGELREEKFRLRFRMGTMQLENPRMLRHIRRDVARLNTILRERELSETPTAASETPTPTPEAAETPETAEAAETVGTPETVETTAAEETPTEAAEPPAEAAEPPEPEE